MICWLTHLFCLASSFVFVIWQFNSCVFSLDFIPQAGDILQDEALTLSFDITHKEIMCLFVLFYIYDKIANKSAVSRIPVAPFTNMV